MNEAIPHKNQLWTILIGALFITAISGSLFFVYTAFQTDNGVITKSPYEDSLLYQKKLDKLTHTRGNVGKIHIQSATQKLQIQIKDKNGESATGLKLTYVARYPANQEFDHQGSFEENEGSYIVSETLPKTGVWLFSISTTGDGAKALWEKQITVY